MTFLLTYLIGNDVFNVEFPDHSSAQEYADYLRAEWLGRVFFYVRIEMKTRGD